MHGATAIDLRNAGLQHIPNLAGRAATTLNVSGNKIRMLWDEDLPQGLQEFHAEDNQIMDDGLLIQWPQTLRVLNLANNPFRYLEHTQWWPASLRELTLSGCALRGTLAHLPSTLEVLLVDRTDLEAILHLPASLREFSAAESRLQRLPRHLPTGLLSADLSRCRLNSKALPMRWPATLQRLDLHGNSLAQFPGGLPAGLRWLNVSGNRLERLGAIPEGLEILLAGRNYIREIPEWLPARRTRYAIQDNCLCRLPPGTNCMAAEEQWFGPAFDVAARLIQARWAVYRLRKAVRVWSRLAALKWELIATAMHPDRAGRFEDISPEWSRK